MPIQTFDTNLNFKEVPAGTIEDNILVRASNGDVKQVPASDFGTVGGDKTLQQVVAFSTTDEITTAIFDEATSVDEIRSIGAKFTELTEDQEENDFKIKFSAKGVSLERTEINYGYSEKVTFEHDGIQLQSSEPDDEFYLKMDYPRKREHTIKYRAFMPISVDGNLADEYGNITTQGFSGTPQTVPKFDESGNLLENSPITIEDTTTVMNSGITDDSGLKFANLKSSTNYEQTTVSTSQPFPEVTSQNINNGDIALIYQDGNNIDILDKEGTFKFTTVLSHKPIGISYDKSSNLFVLLTNNTVVKIDSDFNIEESFTSNAAFQSLLFADNVMFCINVNGSVSMLNTITGALTAYGNIKTGSSYAVGANNDFFTIANDGVYKSNGNEIVSFYLPIGVELSNLSFKNGILYVADVTNNTVKGLDSNGVVMFEAETGTMPQIIAFDSNEDLLVYSNYSPMFLSEIRSIKLSGELKVLATNVGTNFRSLYCDSSDNLYGVSWSSSFWRKFVPSEKDYLLSVNNEGKVVPFDKKSLTQIYTNKSLNSLTAYALNNDYPNAKKGDTVQCLHISNGAKIYTKTDTNWVEQSVTAVS